MLETIFPYTSKEINNLISIFTDELKNNLDNIAKEINKKDLKNKEHENEKNKGNFLFNVYENDKKIKLEIALPGIKKEDIIIDLEKSRNKKNTTTLIILAERKNNNNKNYKEVIKNLSEEYILELDFSDEKYNLTNCEAKYENGILEIKIPLKNNINKIKIK